MLFAQGFSIDEWHPLVVDEQRCRHWNSDTLNLERWNAQGAFPSRKGGQCFSHYFASLL
jgi:hypothetical protein